MPIAFSEKEWARIKKWTAPEKGDPETPRRRDYIKYLDTKSREMTKLWPNSAKNINIRNEEQRLARIEADEQANTMFYKCYLKQKKQEQEQRKSSTSDFMFKSKDAPKLLLSAVIETAVQKERMAQITFMNERRRQEAEKKWKNNNHVLQQAKEWNDLMALRRQERFEVNKQHQQAILQQAHEVAEQNRTMYETEHNLQKIENMKANEEMKAMKEFDVNYREREKLRIFNDMNQAKEDTDARKREQIARDKMDNKLIEVLNNSRARIEHRRKQTELDEKNDKLRVLEAIGATLETGEAERDAEEQAILQKVIKEKKAIEDARIEADWRRNEQLRQDRLAAREQFLRDEEHRLHEFNIKRQFEIMNRLKNTQLFEEFKDGQRQEKIRKAKEYRADILKLWKEREDREARELAETRYFHGERVEKKIQHEDKKVLMHAALLIEEARRLGRPDYPLHRAVDRYCKMHGLHPIPRLGGPIAEHVLHSSTQEASRPAASGSKEQNREQTGEFDQHHYQQKSSKQAQKEIDEGCPSKSASNKLEMHDKKSTNTLQKRDSKTTLGIGLLPPVT